MTRPPPISRAHVYRKLTNYTGQNGDVWSQLDWSPHDLFHIHTCVDIFWCGQEVWPYLTTMDASYYATFVEARSDSRIFSVIVYQYYNIIKAAVSLVSFYPLRLYSWKMNNMKIKLAVGYELARPKKSCEVSIEMVPVCFQRCIHLFIFLNFLYRRILAARPHRHRAPNMGRTTQTLSL